MHDISRVTFDDPLKIIKDTCPKYPAPYYRGYNAPNRITQLETFEADAIEVTAALTRQALKAIAEYLRWLECNVEVAENEKYAMAEKNGFTFESVEGIHELLRIRPIIEELLADASIKHAAYNKRETINGVCHQ